MLCQSRALIRTLPPPPACLALPGFTGLRLPRRCRPVSGGAREHGIPHCLPPASGPRPSCAAIGEIVARQVGATPMALHLRGMVR